MLAYSIEILGIGSGNEAGYISLQHDNKFTLEKEHTICSLSHRGGELVKIAAAPLPRATSMAPVSVARSITAEGLKE